jgi:hypothetical protein
MVQCAGISSGEPPAKHSRFTKLLLSLSKIIQTEPPAKDGGTILSGLDCAMLSKSVADRRTDKILPSIRRKQDS